MSTDHPQHQPDEGQATHDSLSPEEKDELFETAPAEGDSQKQSRIHRGLGWLKKRRFQVGIGSLLVLLALFSGIIFSWLSTDHSNEQQIRQAMEALEVGDLTQAKEVATEIALDAGKTERDTADAAFILGMVATDNAEAGWPDEQSSYTLAARYFDIAYPSGFPKPFEFLGLKTYGKVLLECGRFAKSRQVLQRALRIAKDILEKNAVRYLLVKNDIEAENPDLTEAAQENKAYLATKKLSESQRTDGNLQRLQLQTRQNQFESAHKTLALLPKTPAYSDKVCYAQGRLAMREAEVDLAKEHKVSDQVRAKLDEAIKSFRRAQGRADETNPIIPKARYLIGNCFAMSGENRAAIQQWKQVCEFFPDSPEATASKYRLAELHFADDALEKFGTEATPTEMMPAEAIGYLSQTVEALTKDHRDNPWITRAEIRKNASRRIQVFQKAGKLKAALEVAKAISPLLDKKKTLRLQTTLDRELGQRMLDELDSSARDEKAILKQRRARKYFREASVFYAVLARQEITSKRYSDDLWNRAECALKGCDFTGAIPAFIKYLNTEPVKRNAAALLGLGEAYLSLGEIEEAIDTFEQCIEFYPSDVATFRARLLAAEAWQDKGDMKPAEQLLLDNWSAAGITPKSLVWQETVYRLGELYHNTKQYDKAIERLSDAVRRFPDKPQTNLARYLLADSYRLRATAAQERIVKTMTRSKLTVQKAAIEADFNAAYHQYKSLQQKIGSRLGNAEISEQDNLLLRNSRLFAAGVLLQLGQYQQAIKAYSTVSLHYLGQPISIQAMKQKAQALANLGENAKAQLLVRQILSQLEKMGPDLPYEETTLYTYNEWIEMLKQMEKEFAMKQQAENTLKLSAAQNTEIR